MGKRVYFGKKREGGADKRFHIVVHQPVVTSSGGRGGVKNLQAVKKEGRKE